MAVDPKRYGPRQIFQSRIVKIKFKTSEGGLISFAFKYDDGYLEEFSPPQPDGGNSPRSKYDITFDFSGSIVQLENFGLLDGTHNIPGPELKEPIKSELVPVENPITQKMVEKYVVWTPRAQIDEQISKSFPAEPGITILTA